MASALPHLKVASLVVISAVLASVHQATIHHRIHQVPAVLVVLLDMVLMLASEVLVLASEVLVLASEVPVLASEVPVLVVVLALAHHTNHQASPQVEVLLVVLV